MIDKRNYITLRLKPLKEGLPRSCKIINHQEFEFGNEKKQTLYKFDYIFKEKDNNQKIFDTMVIKILEKFLIGENCMICVHGQTSSGKTYTMTGSQNQDGIILMAAKFIFSSPIILKGQLYMECYEIYNETINDLLIESELNKNSKYNIGCKCIQIASIESFRNNYKKCEVKRHIRETNMNQQSSRGHLMLKLKFQYVENEILKESQIFFIDLAGSESSKDISASKQQQFTNKDQSRQQGQKINQSLLAFENIINQIIQQQEKKENIKQFLQSRDSLLSYHLKSLINENSCMGFILTIHPDSNNYFQTQQTLKFAKQIGALKYSDKLKNQSNIKQNQEQIQGVKCQHDEQLANLFNICNNLRQENQHIREIQRNTENQQNEKIKLLESEILNLKRQLFNKKILDENRNQTISSKRQQILKDLQLEEQKQNQQEDNEGEQEQDQDQVQADNKNQQDIQKNELIEFDFIDQHFKLISDITQESFKDYFITYPKKRYTNKTFIVLISYNKDEIIIRNQIQQMFNFNIGSLIILKNVDQYYIIIKLQYPIQFRESFFYKRTKDLILINRDIKTEKIIKMFNKFEVKYSLQNIIKNNIEYIQIYLDNTIYCSTIEFLYMNMQNEQVGVVEQLILKLDLKKYYHIVHKSQDTLKFLIHFDNPQYILILDYLSQYHRPSITLIDSKYTFSQIQQYYQHKMKENLYYVTDNKFQEFKNIIVEEIMDIYE